MQVKRTGVGVVVVVGVAIGGEVLGGGRRCSCTSTLLQYFSISPKSQSKFLYRK